MSAPPMESRYNPLVMLDYRSDQTPLVAPGSLELLPNDMTLIAGAEATLGAAQERLREFNQWLPIDGDGAATLGALVAGNSTGPLRLGYGAWRDLLLGAQFLNGKGELVTAGGRTVKNVAGYDLTKFIVGQRGVFGRIATVTTRTYRRPAGAILATFGPEPQQLNRLLPTSCRPQWAVMKESGLLCGYLGDERTLDYYESVLPRYGPVAVERRPLEADVEHRRTLWRVEAAHDRWCRAAVPPAAVRAFVARAGLGDWVADAAFGVVLAATGPLEHAHDEQERIHSAAVAAGGSVYFIEPGGQCDRYPDAAEEKLLEALKSAFDPDHQLEAL